MTERKKRQKTVFTTQELPHLFANKVVPQGQARGSARESFLGDFYYSYTTVVARHVQGRGKQKNKAAVLISERSYSPTTARHISSVRRACSHLLVLEGPLHGNGDFKPAEWLENYKVKLSECLARIPKARGAASALALQIERVVSDANKMAALFGLKTRLKLPKNWHITIREVKYRAAKHEALLEPLRARARQRWDAERMIRDKQRVEELEKRRFAAPINLQKWLEGHKDGWIDREIYAETDYLRLVPDTPATELETSMGARASLEHAKRLYDHLAPIKRTGALPILFRDIEIGGYPVKELDAVGTLRVGCHKFSWDEIERFAKTQNWTPAEPSTQETMSK